MGTNGVAVDTPVGSGKPELGNLTGLRAVAASWVVVEHFRLVIFALFPNADFLRPWIRSGYLGVEVFFVLSGFIIAYTYADRLRGPTCAKYRQFIELRFARVYPAHFATLAIMLALILGARALGITLSAGDNYTFGTFLGNVFLLQAIPAFPAWNPPAWSISAEFAAYLAFPAIAIVLARVRTARAAIAIAGALTIVGGIGMLSLQSAGLSETGGVLIAIRIAVEFTAGGFLYVAWTHLQELHRRTWAVLAVSGTLAVIAAIGFVGPSGALVVVPLIAVVVVASASAGGFVGQLLSSRVMRWGGRVSYSVYMVHFIVLMVLGELLPREHFAGSTVFIRVAVLATFFGTTVLGGWLCYSIVEEPSRKGIRRLLSRSSERRPVGDSTAS